MSAPVTEAHRKLVAAIIRDLSIDDGAQLIADSEAAAVEPWRTQVEELRGALALGQENCDDVFDDLREERDQLRADVEQWELAFQEEFAQADSVERELEQAIITRDAACIKLSGELREARAEVDSIKQEIEMVEHRAYRAEAKISNQADRIRYLEGATNHATGTPLSQAIARAERAEAELATERARLDYLSTRGFEHLHHETGDHLGYEWTISSYSEPEDVTLRDAIDAEMREEAK